MTAEERTWRDLEFGYFVNDGLNGRPLGYDADIYAYVKRHWWSAAVPQYHFKLRMDTPLTYVFGRRPARRLDVPVGTECQPCKEMDFDFGSVPSPLWWVYHPSRFLGWIWHDDSYLHRYTWIREPGSTIWYKRNLDRPDTDHLFCFDAIGAQDGNAADRNLIYSSVRLGGGWVWDRHDSEFAVVPAAA